jgi:hypothetical protein
MHLGISKIRLLEDDTDYMQYGGRLYQEDRA